MEIIQTGIEGLVIVKPDVFNDSRGYFLETYNALRYKENGINADFSQSNQSKSGFGVIRGLHYQLAPYSQSKLVSVICGKVYDVAVDLRKNSNTFGKWYGVELSDENKLQFFIPQGFAHGFSVLSKTAVFSYMCDNFYTPQADRGIAYNDPFLNIDWKVPKETAVISEKDLRHPLLHQAEMNF